MEIVLAGETVRLCPEGALYWPAESTLFVADLHWGKTGTFRAHSIPVGDGPLHADLVELSGVIERTAAQRLVVLGDLLHHRRGLSSALDASVQCWRSEHERLDVMLVRGNHDRASGDPPVAWQIECVDEGHEVGPFLLRHIYRGEQHRFVLAGHEHPKVRLSGSGDELKLPCFWQRKGGMILPAMSRFVDSAVVRPQAGDRLYVLTGDAVICADTVVPVPKWIRRGATRAPGR